VAGNPSFVTRVPLASDRDSKTLVPNLDQPLI
jgi:hypothetical protein